MTAIHRAMRNEIEKLLQERLAGLHTPQEPGGLPRQLVRVNHVDPGAERPLRRARRGVGVL